MMLWRGKPDNDVLTQSVESNVSPAVVPRIAILPEAAKLQPVADQPSPSPAPRAASAARAPAVSVTAAARAARPATLSLAAAAPAAAQGAPGSAPVAAPRMSYRAIMQSPEVSISQRMMINRELMTVAPTQTATTNSMSISFSYCLVKIARPWMMDEFFNSGSWCIPHKKKGELSSSAASGAMPMMPVAFVAVRDLEIIANWTADDVRNAANSTHFGPFAITPGIVGNTLKHEGIQLIGWLLQKMPEIPPVDPPAQ
jgi:hypothetical protein